MPGVLNAHIEDTPIAVFDFETTGLTPGRDRVVEISVVRKDPGCEPKMVFDTLVNPRRPVSATEIHGITDEDVKSAPYFEDIAGEFLHAISGCVVAAYNVYFDIKFFTYEFSRAGAPFEPPHFCLMYLRPMLDLGARCCLADACKASSIDCEQMHMAAHDAHACSQLLDRYMVEMRRRNVRTFEDLAALRSYKFIKSFEKNPPCKDQFQLSRCSELRSRFHTKPEGHHSDPTLRAVRAYWDALKTVVADLDITSEEVSRMVELRTALRMPAEHVRALHARAFANAISQFMDDLMIEDREVRKLQLLRSALSKLGWAPGD
jgi:DNA polymerase III subunit epsilon